MIDKLDIKWLFIDVDGTMTDGKITISGDGELFKTFSVKDGLGITQILPKLNIIPVIITGRISEIVEIRATELKITHLYQNVSNKAKLLDELVKKEKILLSQIAYIGDDINDLDAMLKVRIVGCPADATDEVRKIADFISSKDGGAGAVREFIEFLQLRIKGV